MNKKIIIWGHPLHSHTHSYIHEAYYKAFSYLGYNVYWFHDQDYPVDFDFNNCLFITEGYADKNIPINSSSCYMVMYCPSPIKYIEAGRYIDVRMSAYNFQDHIQEYSLDKTKCEKVGPECFFEKRGLGNILIKNNYHNYTMPDFDKLYISWATNMLPCEINLEDCFLPRQNIIHYCGTISSEGVCENMSNFNPFIQECLSNGVPFQHNNPWENPLDSLEMKRRIQESILAIDIRGPEHLRQRLITCRVFKNISYGHLGVTNSMAIYESLDGNCIYSDDSRELFHQGMKNRQNYNLIQNGMRYVAENHTYLNRIKAILEV